MSAISIYTGSKNRGVTANKKKNKIVEMGIEEERNANRTWEEETERGRRKTREDRQRGDVRRNERETYE